MEEKYEPVKILPRISDQYMKEQVAGLYEEITVTTGWKRGLRRICEICAFHELRHLVVRVLVRLGLY